MPPGCETAQLFSNRQNPSFNFASDLKILWVTNNEQRRDSAALHFLDSTTATYVYTAQVTRKTALTEVCTISYAALFQTSVPRSEIVLASISMDSPWTKKATRTRKDLSGELWRYFRSGLGSSRRFHICTRRPQHPRSRSASRFCQNAQIFFVPQHKKIDQRHTASAFGKKLPFMIN